MAKTGKKHAKTDRVAPTKKLLKKEKRKLRAEADAARYQRTDVGSWGDATKRLATDGDATSTKTAAQTVEDAASKAKSPKRVVTKSAPEASSKSYSAKSNGHAVSINGSSALLTQAAMLLSIATGIGLLLGLAVFGLPGGREAVPTMGGVMTATAPLQTAQIVLALDTLFPLFYGAGLAVLVTCFKTRANRPIVRIALTALLVAVVADFAENALAFGVLSGGAVSPFFFPLTVIKYASIAFAGLLVSSIAPRDGALGMIVHGLLRYAFPVLIALLVSGIGGELVRMIVGASFPISLLLLALFASERSAMPSQAAS